MSQLGKLYLIPTTLGETENPFDVLPQTIKRSIELLDYYIVENEKTARKFIKSIQFRLEQYKDELNQKYRLKKDENKQIKLRNYFYTKVLSNTNIGIEFFKPTLYNYTIFKKFKLILVNPVVKNSHLISIQ
jgi:16S rRNA C1402 (ribose-2'-O) methylase RsmI